MPAVLFDMDGVLVDSEDYWVAFERDELLPRVVPDEDVAVAEITGMNYREIYDYLDAEYETAMSREEFLETFESFAHELYTERVSLLDGLHDLLADLDERDADFEGRDADLDDRTVRTAVVSSSPHEWIDLVLDRFDLEGSFDAVVSADDVDGPGKPAPDVFEYAADELDVPIEACVVVEDSENGVEAAARAGATTVAYRIDAHDDLDLSRADVVVNSPEELQDAVLRNV